MSALRRSSRIASRNTMDSAVSALLTLSASPLPPRSSNMSKVDEELYTYNELVEKVQSAEKLEDKLQAQRSQLIFLQTRPHLLDSFTADMVDALRQQINAFHKSHEEYNEYLATLLADTVRWNKNYYIWEGQHAVPTMYSIMGTLLIEKKTHNLFVSLYQDVMMVYHLIKSRV